MGTASTQSVRRRTIALKSAAGDGDMAGIDFGPADRPIDVIFLHANGFNANTCRSILSPLAEEMHILAVDMRGHGRTALEANPEGRTGWGPFRDDLLALLEHLDLPPVVLSGHSMGGCTSLLAGEIAPQRIKRLALFDPVVMPRIPVPRPPPGEGGGNDLLAGALRRRARFPDKAAVIAAYTGRGAFRTWTAQMLADYVEDGFKPTDDGEVELSCSPLWEAANFAAHGHDPWPGLLQSPWPIRILRAEQGSTARIDDQIETLTAGGRVTVETIPGSSHFLPMERPDLVHALLREAVAA